MLLTALFLALAAQPGAAEDLLPPLARAGLALARGDLDQAEALLGKVPPGASRQLTLGLVRQLQGRVDEAEALYRQAAAESPGEAWFRLGMLEQVRGRPRQALEAYQRCLEHEPGQAFAHFNAARILADLGRPGEARRHLDRVLELDPLAAYALVRGLSRQPLHSLNLVPVNRLHAAALLLRGQLADSADDLQASSDLDPQVSGPAWLALGRQALNRGDLATAVLWLQAYLEGAMVATGVSSDLAVWGDGWFRVGLPGGGWGYTRSLRLGVDGQGRLVSDAGSLGVRLPPGAQNVHVDRGGVVRAWLGTALPVPVGRLVLYRLPENARLEPFGPALVLEGEVGPTAFLPGPGAPGEIVAGHRLDHPDTLAAWRMLRQAPPEIQEFVRSQPFESFAEQARRLQEMARDPRWEALARVRLGSLYYGRFTREMQQADLVEAARQWSRAAELRPDLAFVRLNLVGLLFLQGETGRALELLQGLSARQPQRVLPWQLLVAVPLARGDLAAASSAALAFHQRFPNNPYPVYAQAEMLALAGQTARALALLDELLARDPGQIETRYLLVHLLAREGQVVRQERELRLLLEMDPTPYRARRLLAGLLDRLGQKSEAVELYRLYLASPEPLVYETDEYARTTRRFQELFQD